MLSLHGALEIRAPAGLVFEVLTDPRRLPEWNESIAAAEAIDPPPTRLGSRARARGRLFGASLESITEVVAFQPSREFATRAIVGPPIETRFSLEPRPDGCRVAVDVSGTLPGGALAETVARAKLKGDLQRSLARLRELCETEARRRAAAEPAEGGDPACWLHLQSDV